MDKRKIGICLISNGLSGAEKRLLRIFRKLNAISDNYSLIINNKLLELAKRDNEFKSMIDKLLIHKKVIILKSDSQSNFKILNIMATNFEMYKIVKKNNLSIVHLIINAIYVSFGCRVANSKITFEVTSPDVANSLTQGRLKIFTRLVDKFIAVSPTVEKTLLNNWNKNRKTDILERVVCSSIPYFNMPVRESIQGEKENLIVYASRFIDRKNPILFADAIKLFLSSNPEWKVFILGSGPLEGEIKDILSNEINNSQVIIKHTKDIYSYYERSKIFVSLIYPDNYPSQSILEAMSMKNAIIATNVGSTNKFVDNKNGVLVNSYDKSEIVEAINRISSDPETMKSMGEESFMKVKRDFSSDKYIKELIDTYNSL